MRNKMRLFGMLLLFVCFAFCTHNTVHAENEQEVSPEKLAVVLIIDNSESMARTDALKLRETAANIFTDLLSPDDYLGVITFSTKPSVVWNVSQVGSAENKKRLKDTLSSYIVAEGETDYKAAFDEAYGMLGKVTDLNARKIVVFLTDGKPSVKKKENYSQEYMDTYMASMWESESQFVVDKIPVYSVGFGTDIKAAILQRIASDTGGDVRLLNDERSLAQSFFDILGELKNRKNIMSATYDVAKPVELKIPIDAYTSQATIVLLNGAKAKHTIELTAPSGGTGEELVNLAQTDKYSILTINNTEGKGVGTWKLILSGKGLVDVFGDKDLFVKAWVESPANLSVLPYKEPIQMKVKMTGDVGTGLKVLAQVQAPGPGKAKEMELELVEGAYIGTYADTKDQGTYVFTFQILLDGTLLSTAKETVEVRLIPSLVCDLQLNEEGYRVGEKIGLSSSLSVGGIKLIPGRKLTVEQYLLRVVQPDGTSDTIPLQDNGVIGDNDITKGDGVWSGWIQFTEETTMDLSLVVTGTYKDQRFVLEEALGKASAYEPGTILIEAKKANPTGIMGETITIPMVVTNQSKFTELLYVECSDKIGTIMDQKYELEANSKTEIPLRILIRDDAKKGAYPLQLSLRAGNERTTVEVKGLPDSVNIITKSSYYIQTALNTVREIYASIPFPFCTILNVAFGAFALYMVFGYLLYFTLYRYKCLIHGTFDYHAKEKISRVELEKNMDLGGLHKRKIVIRFGNVEKGADYLIANTVHRYDLVLTSEFEKSKLAFLNGWRALRDGKNEVRYRLSVQAPGIIEMDGKIFMEKNLKFGDVFESGGYVFSYRFDGQKKKERGSGRNILEGKDEESSSV